MSNIYKIDQMRETENKAAAELVAELNRQGVAAELVAGSPHANGLSWRHARIKMATNKDVDLTVDSTEGARLWQAGYHAEDLRVWIENRGAGHYNATGRQKVGFRFPESDAEIKALAVKLAAWAVKFEEQEKAEVERAANEKRLQGARKSGAAEFHAMLEPYGPACQFSDSASFRTETGEGLNIEYRHRFNSPRLARFEFSVSVDRVPDLLRVLSESGFVVIKPRGAE